MEVAAGCERGVMDLVKLNIVAAIIYQPILVQYKSVISVETHVLLFSSWLRVRHCGHHPGQSLSFSFFSYFS
jgi:hypothetical protein